MLLLLSRRSSGLLALTSSAIRLAAGGPYSHVDIINPRIKREMFCQPRLDQSFIRQVTTGTIIGATAQHGVAVASMIDRVGHQEVRHWPGVDEDAAWGWAKAQVGKSYDWLGALGVGARRDWQSPDKFSCAELVVHAAIAGGAKIDPNHAWFFGPQHVLAMTEAI